MKKHEIINEVIKNGYHLIEATEYGELVFGKTVGCGDGEVITGIEITNDDRAKDEYQSVSISRSTRKAGEEMDIVQTFWSTFSDIDIDGKAVTNCSNYTSIVL